MLLAGGCAQPNKRDFPTDVLDAEILKTAGCLPVDTIGCMEELIYARDFRVYRDSILIVLNRKHTDGYFVELRNLYTKKKIAELYRLGDGPEEMLSAKVNIHGDMLLVNDYVKGQVATVHLDSLLGSPSYKALPVRHQVAGCSTAVPYEDGFLLENPYCFSDDDLGVNQEAPRFIVTDGKAPYKEKKRYKYYTRNVAVDGCIITNYSRDRVVYASMGQSVLEIYDKNLNLRQVITGPVDLKAKYRIGGEFDEPNEICYNGYIPYAYMDYCMDEDGFYLSYIGDYLTAEKKMKDLPGWLLKFDWDGKLTGCFKIGSYVQSVSKCGNTLYMTVLNEESAPVLLKMDEDED